MEVETIQVYSHWLRRMKQSQTPPKFVFVKIDIYTKENKNGYVFPYFESLAAWWLSHEVTISSLPVGHTLEDINKAFGISSSRFSSRDAVAFEDLHSELFNVYNKEITVGKLEHIANFSALSSKQGCLQPGKGISHFKYFWFMGKRDSSIPSYSSYCHETWIFEDNISQEWSTLQMRVRASRNGNILLGNVHGSKAFPPNLDFTTSTFIK